MIRAGLLLACLALAACEPEPKLFDRDSFPDRLSEWGLLTVAGGDLRLHSESTAYDLNAPLFTDYAHKLRTVWTPADATGSIAADGELLLPVGAVITKTFYYPADGQGMMHVDADPVQFTDDGLNLDQVYLMETRLLVHLEDGWHGLPYVWNEDQTDATLEITGGVYPVNVTGIGEFNYVVPDFNQCQGCHETDLTAAKMGPIGLKARHLDKAYPWLHGADDQLGHLVQRHRLDGLADADYRANAGPGDMEASLDHRARSYLDINCGHCHSPVGAADTSGMFLNIEETDPLKLGVCKPPVAAGQGTGGFLFGIDPGNGKESILTFRMESLDPGAMMPELGRSLVHEEGVELIIDWIEAMSGEC